MAKKTVKNQNFWEDYKHYIIPSGIGGLITLVFTNTWGLAIAVFVGVWVGNWIVQEMLPKK